jgi:hypothetical protein
VTLIVDAGPLIALADDDDPRVDLVRDVILEERGDLVLPAYVAAEADYMITTRIGPSAEQIFLRDLASGLYLVEAMTSDEHELAVEVDSSYPGLGLADLSIVVLAARHDTNRILTFDDRDFRRVPPIQGGAFTLLPADEPPAPA